LRQEFCELELLDEITNFRNPLIRGYQQWKGTDYVPPLTHSALKWSVKDPLPSFLSVVNDAPWQIIDKKKKKEVEFETAKIHSGFVAAKGSVPVKSGKKQKLEEADGLSASVKKKGSSNDNSF